MRIRHGFVDARVLSSVHGMYYTIFAVFQSIPKRSTLRFGISKTECTPFWKGRCKDCDMRCALVPNSAYEVYREAA